MLRQLYIKNFTLIDELDISFEGGFSVITGETGAGKSIILGALGLLLGQRADTKAIKAGRDRCTVEAHFDLRKYDMEPFFEEKDLDFDEGDCILRREVRGKAVLSSTTPPWHSPRSANWGQCLSTSTASTRTCCSTRRTSNSTCSTSSPAMRKH